MRNALRKVSQRYFILTRYRKMQVRIPNYKKNQHYVCTENLVSTIVGDIAGWFA
jgi:hypothetical protein